MAFASIKMNKYSFSGCYTDVNSGDWYASTMQTANETKIIPEQMIADGKISPNQKITREETASVLSKLLTAAGKRKDGDLTVFADSFETDTWASADMANIVGFEIMQGDENKKLNPQKTLTRAEACSLIKRFMSAYLSN